MTIRLFTVPYFTPIDSEGVPIVGATLTFYASDSNILLDTYADAAFTIPNRNPMYALDSPTFSAIYLQAALYRVVLKDANGAEIWTADPVGGVDTDTIYAPSFEYIGNGQPFSNDVLGLHTHILDVTYPQGFFGSYGNALIPPTNPYTALVLRNGVQVGSFTITTIGTFGFTTLNNQPVAYKAGDVMEIYGAQTPDPTLANFAWTFAGTLTT